MDVTNIVKSKKVSELNEPLKEKSLIPRSLTKGLSFLNIGIGSRTYGLQKLQYIGSSANFLCGYFTSLEKLHFWHL